MIIAGLGSEKTPSTVLQEMEKIGTWIRQNNHRMFSSHSPGAGWYFERGAMRSCVPYIPWVGYNKKYESPAVPQVVPNTIEYNAFTNKFHPIPSRLSPADRLLMNCSACQILGFSLKTKVDALVCYTENGAVVGGAAQAMRIAKGYNVPILNMYHQECNTAGKVIEVLGAITK